MALFPLKKDSSKQLILLQKLFLQNFEEFTQEFTAFMNTHLLKCLRPYKRQEIRDTRNNIAFVMDKSAREIFIDIFHESSFQIKFSHTIFILVAY